MTSTQQPTLRFPLFSGLVLLLLRGLLLWIIVPLGLVCWLLGLPWWRKRRVALRQLLGWADLNLIAAIHRGLLRPLVRRPSPWVPFDEIPTVTHRVRLIDAA